MRLLRRLDGILRQHCANTSGSIWGQLRHLTATGLEHWSLLETLKYPKSVLFAGRGKSFAAQQITTGMIGDRQGIAILAIAEQEFAFVIGAPEFIGIFAYR